MLKKFLLMLALSALTVTAFSGCEGNEKCRANNNNHPEYAAENCTRTPVQGSNYCRFHVCGLDQTSCRNRNGMPVASIGSQGEIECTSCS